ncbi:aromatic compound dioxygenase [Setomelanomma holmii]|uniref:Aromatic compound dioxygenase n=1 Tax=Setomelanomma holmii TaxID=210430 RepID=A0A9P4LKL3_9PLEO|nr:aromatic compound dioxygenase [Setomelanomma holmii]
MIASSFLAKLAWISFAGQVLAHPGHEEHSANHAVKRSFLANTRRSLDGCAAHLEKRGSLKAAEVHRRKFLDDLRKRALADGLQRRDTDTVLNTSHHSDLVGITVDTDASTLFSNDTCILSPEGEIGPFWVKGELNREDIVDNEPGVVNYMHAQFIDISTCEPIPSLWWDVWNCNSTGVYSGVQDSSNGNGDDASNLNETALRGIQQTDENGIATFRSVFPGHYSGRATHVHVVGHLNATLLANGTISGGSVSHIGQLFFDQDLISEVEGTLPYNTSTIDITLNSVDRVFAFETEDSNSDPVFNYVYLTEEEGAEGGLFSWITIGVDTTAAYNTSYAALLTQDGGVANSNAGTSGGSGSLGAGAPSGVPSGGIPSGTVTAA